MEDRIVVMLIRMYIFLFLWKCVGLHQEVTDSIISFSSGGNKSRPKLGLTAET